MKTVSKNCIMFLILFLLLQPVLFTQNQGKNSIGINDFAGTLSFLSSDWLEGREAGEKGSFIAADFIASIMEYAGLQPYGDRIKKDNRGRERTYFETFEVISYRTVSASLSVIKESKLSSSEKNFLYGIDFEIEPLVNNLRGEAPLVFAGYGLSAPESGYDDYLDLEVRGKAVVVMEGYPGEYDTASAAYQKFRDINAEWETKQKLASDKGAAALIMIYQGGNYKPYSNSPANSNLLNSSMDGDKFAEPEYHDNNFILPFQLPDNSIPFFSLSREAGKKLLEGTGIDLVKAEKRAAEKLQTTQLYIKNIKCGYSVTVESEPVYARNVIGIIPGADSSKTIILGAHYDHLGKREEVVYNGADDNASGTAGILALAKYWKDRGEVPPVNLVFAAWAAEEKGYIGSIYYVRERNADPFNTPLAFNFDMISRSAPEDSTERIISVGTLKASSELREIAKNNNGRFSEPFNLDLWFCSENGGSDYTSFAAKNIPVLTFFSGFHTDYHTEKDVFRKVNLVKMQDILNFARGCLNDYLDGNYTGRVKSK